MDQPVNSSAWWDHIFRESWEVSQGSEQTYGFMHALLVNLPDLELAYLATHELDMLDWGCAFGDGAGTLSAAFPSSHVAGLDFSAAAVEEARKRYPECEFINTPHGEIPRDFDVIFTSNCLEHFASPLDVAKTHMAHCTTAYIAMVPYEEQPPLTEGHAFRFDQHSFPEQLGAFVRLSAQPLDTPRLYWPGRQLLVVYGSPAYAAQRSAQALQLADAQHIMRLRVGMLEQERRRLADSLVRARQEMYDIWALCEEKDKALAGLYEQIDQDRKKTDDL